MSKPIRVLQVVTHMNRGGLETMIMNYYRKIDKNKIQFDFLTHRPANEIKDYDTEIKELGGKIFHLPRLNPFSFKYHKALTEFFEEHAEYQIIHVHQDCMSSVILKHAKRAGVPVRIAHCHSSNQDRNILYPVKLFYKKKIKKYATHMLACGIIAGNWMFGDDVRFNVLPNAIDLEQYIYSLEVRDRVRSEFNIDSDTFVIGNVGRFCKVKNHTFLVDVFGEVLKENSKAKLVLVGKGENMGRIRSKVKEMGIESSVLFLGVRKDVCELLQMMDIFVAPSIYEGVPVSIIEAQAAGLRCVISSGIPMDCKITDLVTQIGLDKGIYYWSEHILNNCIYQRTNRSEDIKKNHYDIAENAKRLQNLYLNEIDG